MGAERAKAVEAVARRRAVLSRSRSQPIEVCPLHRNVPTALARGVEHGQLSISGQAATGAAVHRDQDSSKGLRRRYPKPIGRKKQNVTDTADVGRDPTQSWVKGPSGCVISFLSDLT